MSFLGNLLQGRSGEVLGLNRRNLEYVYPKNPRWAFALADDKCKAKAVLTEAGVPVAPTLHVFESFEQLGDLETVLEPQDDFVMKPSHGRAGRGVLVMAGRNGDIRVTAGGRHVSAAELRRHAADIVFGVYSLDRPDAALIEPRLRADDFFHRLAPTGLADVRVICVDGTPRIAMIRAPTEASEGRANIHQGAVGIGVALATGELSGGWHQRRRVDTHPDTGVSLRGTQIPGWKDILDLSRRVADHLPLKYIGLDVIVDADLGPLILEFNARPGLEIQNVCGIPMLSVLHADAATGVSA